jgi:3-oxo-5-alpha-steroid 4-dehydrogenase 1
VAHTLQLGLVIFIFAVSALSFWASLKVVNPYGRHMQPGQPNTLPALPAWLLFEAPQFFSFALTFWLTAQSPSPAALTLFGLWQAHYTYRAILYPLRMRDRHKRFPISGVVFGILFNSINGFINGYAVAHAPHLASAAWLGDPRFVLGLAVAVAGWLVNFQADTILINLRRDGSTGYKVPYGGMFRWVSSANYFGEIVLWCGWALMSWTPAGLSFAVFTTANLLPRALSHHRWYHQHFAEYPKERRAIIPGVL